MSDHFNLWLQYVDKQLSVEAFEFLKLGLHSEFHRYYTEVEELDRPSLLFYFLLKQRKESSETQVLQMFLHVVEVLGKKLRGDLVIKKGFGEGSVYKLTHPGPYDTENASKEFKFFLCLLKILLIVRQNVDLCDQLKTKFTRGRFLDINHRHVRNLAELFIRLCQRGFFTPDDTLYLQQALIKREAWECLQVLNDYHESVGMMLIPQAEKVKHMFDGAIYSSSEPASAYTSTSDDALALYRYKGTLAPAESESDDDDHKDIKVFLVDTVDAHKSLKPEGGMGEGGDSGVLECSETTRMLTGTPEVDWSHTEKMIKGTGDDVVGEGEASQARSSASSKLGNRIFGFLMAIFFFAIVSLTVVLVFVAWIPLQPLPANVVPIHNGSIIIVKVIDSLFHGTVTVSIVRKHLEYNTDIHFYGVVGHCDGMNVIQIPTRSVMLTEKNISSFVPEYYVLEGSFFWYEISGSSDKPSHVEVCADRQSSENKTSPGECIRLEFEHGSGYYRVPKPGYYSFRIEPHQALGDYKLTVTENLRILTVNLDESLECSISSTNMITQCNFALPLTLKYCLMAKLDQPIATSDVQLEVQVTDSRLDIMLAIPLSLLVLLIALFFSVLCVYLKFCIKRQSRVM